jgi:hypothetical protein
MDDLKEIAAKLRNEHDVLPFMTGLYAAKLLAFRPLPNEMRVVLEGSADYQSPAPGTGPIWLQIAVQNEAAELIVYRPRVNNQLYVMAPGHD